MRRRLLSIVALSCLVGVAPADEPKKAAPPAKAAADGELKAGWDKYQKELKEKIDFARKANPADQKELLSEIREFQVIELDKLFELATKEPATPIAFDVFSELLFTSLDKDKPKAARALVIKHHLDQPHVKKILFGLADPRDDKGEELLKGVLEKNKDKECLGIANLALGMSAKAKAKGSGGQAKEELLKKAGDYLTTAKSKYADVKVEGETVGKIADGQLAALKLVDALQVGKPVPEIAGEDLNGKAVKLSGYKGKVVMLSFWATWCPPCMGLVPHERELVEKMKDKPFALVGVNGDELDEGVRKVIADKKITWTSFKDQQKDQAPISQTWDIEGWPTIYVIDHKGVIRHIQTGSQGIDKVDQLVEKLVADAGKEKK